MGVGPARRATLPAVVAVLVAVAVTCVAACGSEHGAALVDGGALGLSATLVQNREDVAPRRLQVKLTNGTSGQLRVVDVRLSWAGLEELPAAEQGVLYGVGQRTDLPVPYGDARCPEDLSSDSPPGTPIVAVATIEWPDGKRDEVAVPVNDVEGVLSLLYRADCRRQFIDAAVGLELTGSWERVDSGGEPTLRGELSVDRRNATGTITILDISGSVLLNLRPAPGVGEPMLTLGPSESAGAVPLDVTGSRCDAHALADSKQTFLFQLELDLGDGPEGYVFTPSPDLRAMMQQLINDHCEL